MVDGNIYLIKLVKSKPVLWNNTLATYKDAELKNICWIEIGQQIKHDDLWIKKRWIYLREQFVKELRIKYLSGNKKSFVPKFKYYKDMEFLTKFIKFRHNRDINNISDKRTNNTTFEIEENDADDKDEMFIFGENEQYHKRHFFNEVKHDTEEFTITKDDILEEHADEDIDSDNIFVELTDTEVNNEEYHTDIDDDQRPDDKNIIVDNATEIEIEADAPNEISDINVQTTGTNQTICDENKCTNCKSNKDRCEDIIFGEFVAAMLKNMKNDKKKEIKKEIMNLLL